MDTAVSLTQRVAGEVRAHMARQRKTGVELASLLQISQQSASRRLSGATRLDLDELDLIAGWLDVPAADLLGVPTQVAS